MGLGWALDSTFNNGPSPFGCQAGGVLKRWRSAAGVSCPGAMAGRWPSTAATGTWRGSKLGSLDKGVATRAGWDWVMRR